MARPTMLDPHARRMKARIFRYFSERLGDKSVPVEEIAAKHGISRAQAYRMWSELNAWEAKANTQAEIDDLLNDHRFAKYKTATGASIAGELLMFLSGRLVLAYTQGEIDDLAHNPGEGPAIGTEPTDSLLD